MHRAWMRRAAAIAVPVCGAVAFGTAPAAADEIVTIRIEEGALGVLEPVEGIVDVPAAPVRLVAIEVGEPGRPEPPSDQTVEPPDKSRALDPQRTEDPAASETRWRQVRQTTAQAPSAESVSQPSLQPDATEGISSLPRSAPTPVLPGRPPLVFAYLVCAIGAALLTPYPRSYVRREAASLRG